MKGRGLESWSFAMITFLLLGAALSACSYGVVVSVHSTEEDAIAESEERDAVVLLTDVANQFRLEPVSHTVHLESVRRRGANPGFERREIARFVREKEPDTGDSRIFLWIGVVKSTGTLEVVIRAADNTGQTTFTESLESAVVAALHDAVPGAKLKVRRLRNMPLFSAP